MTYNYETRSYEFDYNIVSKMKNLLYNSDYNKYEAEIIEDNTLELYDKSNCAFIFFRAPVVNQLLLSELMNYYIYFYKLSGKYDYAFLIIDTEVLNNDCAMFLDTGLKFDNYVRMNSFNHPILPIVIEDGKKVYCCTGSNISGLDLVDRKKLSNKFNNDNRECCEAMDYFDLIMMKLSKKQGKTIRKKTSISYTTDIKLIPNNFYPDDINILSKYSFNHSFFKNIIIYFLMLPCICFIGEMMRWFDYFNMSLMIVLIIGYIAIGIEYLFRMKKRYSKLESIFVQKDYSVFKEILKICLMNKKFKEDSSDTFVKRNIIISFRGDELIISNKTKGNILSMKFIEGSNKLLIAEKNKISFFELLLLYSLFKEYTKYL